MMLCDSAQRDAATGKMHMLGGDWAVVGPDLPSMALAVFLRIPWAELEQPRPFVLRLLDGERNPVQGELEQMGEYAPIQFAGEVQLSGAAHLPEDDPARLVDIHSSFSVNLLLAEGALKPGLHLWVLEVAGAEVASVAFVLRPPGAE